MELKDFVSQTLSQIIEGIEDAQLNKGTTAKINPSGLRMGEKIHSMFFDFNTHTIIANIEFDVAVTTEEAKGTKGGIGVLVGAITLGAQGQSDTKNTSLSRIKFSVPVSFPTTPMPPPPSQNT
ncbi:MAG: hypothetical protein WC708_19750 [Lentisphaeria bacterium]